MAEDIQLRCELRSQRPHQMWKAVAVSASRGIGGGALPASGRPGMRKGRSAGSRRQRGIGNGNQRTFQTNDRPAPYR